MLSTITHIILHYYYYIIQKSMATPVGPLALSVGHHLHGGGIIGGDDQLGKGLQRADILRDVLLRAGILLVVILHASILRATILCDGLPRIHALASPEPMGVDHDPTVLGAVVANLPIGLIYVDPSMA